MPTPSSLQLLRETLREYREDDALQLGAALAYYMSLSLAPLLITILALAGLFFSTDTVRQEVVTQLEQLVGERPAATVGSVLENADQPALGKITALAGTFMLFVGASGVFAQLQKSLNAIWDVKLKDDVGFRHMLKVRLTSIGMVLALGMVLIVSLVASTTIAAVMKYFNAWLPAGGWLASTINLLVSFAIITVLFGLIFKVLPDVKITWRDVWVGALITAGLFLIGQTLIGFYLGHTSTGSAYGAAGSLLVLLIWVYYSSQVFFLGAEFTQVWSRHFGAGIRPAAHAQRSTGADRTKG